MIRTIIGTAMLAAIVAAVMPAHAAPETRSQPVATADLNLANPAAVVELRHRINGAVAAVCDGGMPTDLRGFADAARCRKEATKRANVALLAVVEQQRSASRAGEGVKVAAR